MGIDLAKLVTNPTTRELHGTRSKMFVNQQRERASYRGKCLDEILCLERDIVRR